MNSFAIKVIVRDAIKFEDELRILRELCDEAAQRARCLELLQSLQSHPFLDSEHQVVFESICFLFLRGNVSPARLGVHLNNRGFPDVDLKKYFPATNANVTPIGTTDTENK